MANGKKKQTQGKMYGPKPAPTPAQIQRKKARNQRRNQRRKENKKKGMAPYSVRTPGTIIQSLAKGFAMMGLKKNSPYAMCRLMEIAPKMVPSIPDGNNGRHICICAFNSDRLSWSGSGTKSAYLKVHPWIPMPLIVIGADTTLVLNGTGLPSNTTWWPAGVPPEFATSVANTSPGATAIDPYFGVSFRIIAITVAITYTGPVTSCAGLIRATPNSIILQDILQTTNTSSSATAPTSGINLNFKDSTGAVTGWAPINTEVVTYEGNLGAPTIRANTQSFRPEQGCVIRLKHKTGDFKSQPLRDQNLGVAIRGSTAAAGAPVLMNSLVAALGNFGGGIRGFDNDWEGVDVEFSNVNADASFIIDTCVCIEVQPSTTSAMYNLAKESTIPDPQSIKMVQNTLNQHHITHRD